MIGYAQGYGLWSDPIPGSNRSKNTLNYDLSNDVHG